MHSKCWPAKFSSLSPSASTRRKELTTFVNSCFCEWNTINHRKLRLLYYYLCGLTVAEFKEGRNGIERNDRVSAYLYGEYRTLNSQHALQWVQWLFSKESLRRDATEHNLPHTRNLYVAELHFSWRNSLLLADKNAPVHCLVPILFHDVSFVLYAPSQTKIWRSTNLSLPAKIYEKTVVLVEGRMNERRHMATFTCLSLSVSQSVAQWDAKARKPAAAAAADHLWSNTIGSIIIYGQQRLFKFVLPLAEQQLLST